MIDLWFDYSCPYAYLASTQAEALAARAGLALRWRPMLLGGVFAAVGGAPRMPVAKAAWLLQDPERCAAELGVPLNRPAAHPRRTVNALRATLARGSDPAVIHAFFRAYWVEGRAIEDEAVVREIAGDVDLDAQRGPLRATTEEAVALGVFGAPTFVRDGGLWWGHDRAFAAMGLPDPALPPAPGPIEVFFDYSSPFAYLGFARAVDAGLPVVPRPMLLGAVFSAVGQADVPLFSFSDAKRRWMARDLHEQAARAGLPFRFASTFPIRTVLPLRLTLAHPEPLRFARAVFDATWARDEDPNDLAVLRRCGAADALPAGVPDTDDALLAVAAGQKQPLFDATTAAVAAGVFGAPTWRVGGRIAWGQDRLGQILAG